MASLVNFRSLGEQPAGEQQQQPRARCAPGSPESAGWPQDEQPVAGFTVSWRNLSFAIAPHWARPAAPRLVLDALHGSFRSGQLTAILGPSGAGKTTLLECLTGRRRRGLSGSVRIAWADQRPGHKLRVSVIPQNDHLMGQLTVRETLGYASKMKNCRERSRSAHEANVDRVARQLGLADCLASRVNKLSGGQYKRVSIAQELLASPDILILDEPTSGLDTTTCYQTVRVLKELAAGAGPKQIAVVLTIHQPSSAVFRQFDSVYVVGQGGRCVFEGAPAAIGPLMGGLQLAAGHHNPASAIVELAAGKFGVQALQRLSSIQRARYVAPAGALADEASSAADSAVDCASSSCPSERDHHERLAPDPDHEPDVGRAWLESEVHSSASNSNSNNNSSARLSTGAEPRHSDAQPVGCLNEAFVAGQEAPDIGATKAAGTSGDESAGSGPRDPGAQVARCWSHGARPHQRRQRRRRVRRRTAADLPDPLAGQHQHPNLQLPNQQLPNQQHQHPNKQHPNQQRPNQQRPNQQLPADEQCGEKRLKLNSLRAGQRFPFWRHTYLHFHRSWLSIVRDPMLCGMQLALHIVVPVMVSLVYGGHVGKPNACPRAGPVDIMAYALEPADSALQLQEELRTTLENIGYIFFKLYGIIFAAMTVTVLTFPLDMHVLVKEVRNGWYGLPSYFLGRTLADLPFQLTLPLLAMALSYYATGQPASYLQWRFLSITAVLILSSLIAQSQGLLFGAILMDRMKAAVFVAPAATTPIILFAGFLVRIQSIPGYLRPLSNLSYLRYAIEACLISRYGFNQCQCDPAVFNQTVPELPPIARSMLDYWLTSFRQPTVGPTGDTGGDALEPPLVASNASNAINSTNGLETTTLANDPLPSDRPDLFTKLIHSLAKANSFGRNITSCEQVVPYPMIDYDLKDAQLANCFAILLAMLICTRVLTFFIVCFKVKRRL